MSGVWNGNGDGGLRDKLLAALPFAPTGAQTRAVEEVAAEMQATLPSGVEIALIRTLAEGITARLNILLDNGLMGLGLVVLLLFLFFLLLLFR